MIVEEILKIKPKAKIKYVHKDEDPRDYKVDFSKVKKEIGFNITRKAPDELREIYNLLRSLKIPIQECMAIFKGYPKGAIIVQISRRLVLAGSHPVAINSVDEKAH
jgi:hypothetical protein